MNYDHKHIAKARALGMSWGEIATEYPGAVPRNISKAHSRWSRRKEDGGPRPARMAAGKCTDCGAQRGRYSSETRCSECRLRHTVNQTKRYYKRTD